MCGRFTLDPDKRFYPRFKITDAVYDVKPRYNIAPGQFVGVIVSDGITNKLEPMRWGLIPFWAKDPKIGYKMINARVETLNSKASFKYALKKRRCIIPASGFYEWKKSNGSKTPYYIYSRNKDYLALAGLYEIWKDPEGRDLKTFTIITTTPVPIVADLHNRMPLVLNKINEKDWLDPANEDVFQVLMILQNTVSPELTKHAVSAQVNSPAFDSVELLKKVSD